MAVAVADFSSPNKSKNQCPVNVPFEPLPIFMFYFEQFSAEELSFGHSRLMFVCVCDLFRQVSVRFQYILLFFLVK